MKLSIVALILVGLVAIWRSPTVARATEKEVTVMVASRDLPVATVIDVSCIGEQMVSSSKVVAGACSDKTQVIGKVLARPLIAGEAFLEDSFAKGANAELAAKLPPGTRLVTISFSDDAAGRVYPGCLVDVNVDLNIQKENPISGTLLQRVIVMGVDDQTIVSGDPEGKPRDARSGSRKVQVSLQLNQQQANDLQLALKHGSVRLAVLNPSDPKPTAVPLNDIAGMLARAARPPVIAAADPPEAAPTTTQGAQPATVVYTPAPAAPVAKTSITVIRGSQKESHTYVITDRNP